MKISSSVIRSTTRIRSLVALLVLTVVGSSWLVLRADVPQVATGTWTTGGPFGDLPRDVASTVLPDGRLVVTGGSDSDGQPLAMIAIYEPASGSMVARRDDRAARGPYGHGARQWTTAHYRWPDVGRCDGHC